MVWQILLLALASLLGSRVLFDHRRLLLFLAVGGVLFETQWLFLTLLDRTVFQEMATSLVFGAGALVALGLWGALSFFRRRTLKWDWRGDVLIALVVGVVLTGAALIWTRNSFGEASGPWLMHGFFNGDTATLIAITQKAFLTDGLVNENPFAGNGSLEYPTLLHSGIATWWANIREGMDWGEWLPVMTFLQILITVPLFFVLWEVMFPEPKEAWKLWFGVPSRTAVLLVQNVLVLYVMTLSWESYVYPQGHFFLMGMFLLMAALLAQSWPRKILPEAGSRGTGSLPALGVAVLLGVVLLFSNAVTGTAAVFLKIVFDGLRGTRRGVSRVERLGWGAGVVFWVVLFVLFAPGNGSLGIIPGFSYTAAAEMGRLAPILLLVAVGIWLTYGQKIFVSVAALGLMVLALITFTFSARGIVVENASRFFYHAVLIASPLAAVPLVRAYYWFKREFVLSRRSFAEAVVGWGFTIILLGIFLLPAGASVASTHDNLMFKDEQRISPAAREAAGWIADTTSPDDIIIASPVPPFVVPLISGRALLRTDFWLSPDDVILADVKAAFSGEAAAQENVVEQADYLFLTAAEREAWEPLPTAPVFENSEVVIYQL